LVKGKEKRDKKVIKKYGFEEMVSFVLIAGSGDPSAVQNDMPKEVESPQKSKPWELVKLS
jgi:hypothetical protein